MGAVLIEGPKWCGKTRTGMRHSKSALFIGDANSANLAKIGPELALEGERPRLIDEWQDAPILWDVARRAVDMENGRGMFIFTGSSAPPDGSTRHDGTGRFARLRMSPMSLFESGDSSGAVSLSGMFDSGDVPKLRSDLDYRRTVRLICRGGWPGSLGMSDEEAIELPYEYVKSVIASDVAAPGEGRRDSSRTELLLKSLARNSATSAKIASMARDMAADGAAVSEAAVSAGIDALRRVFLIEEQSAWTPSLRSKSRIRTSPKRHFADPSLAAAALGAPPAVLERDVRTAGFLFESLCYRDLRAFATAMRGEVRHYLDNTGLEVDEIVVLRDGRWGAAEVKLGTFEFDKAARNLRALAERVGESVGPPSFLTILTATSGISYKREDGVSVVPMDLLGP